MDKPQTLLKPQSLNPQTASQVVQPLPLWLSNRYQIVIQIT